MVHTGFVIYCGTNDTAAGFTASGRDIVTQYIFNKTRHNQYMADVFMPANCDVQIHFYLCTVAAFNEKGEGPRSLPVTTYLPCNFDRMFYREKDYE